MGKQLSPAALAELDDAPPPSEDKLEKVRNVLRRHRDKTMEKTDLETRLKQVNIEINELEFKTLPDVFNEVGVSNLGLQAEKNFPAYTAELTPHYRANISADWDDEKRAAAFAAIEKIGAGDLIRTAIVVDVPREDRKKAKAVVAALKKLKVQFSVELSTPWNTLTAWVKSRYEDGKKLPPLEVIGATVGECVKPKIVKEK